MMMLHFLALGISLVTRSIAEPTFQTTYMYMCIQACKGWFLNPFETACGECVAHPPVTRKMCDFACSNTYVNKRNYKQLSRICIACFEDDILMRSMCGTECKTDPIKYYRLCKGCVENQFLSNIEF